MVNAMSNKVEFEAWLKQNNTLDRFGEMMTDEDRKRIAVDLVKKAWSTSYLGGYEDGYKAGYKKGWTEKG